MRRPGAAENMTFGIQFRKPHRLVVDLTTTTTTMADHEQPTGIEDIWYLKEVAFGPDGQTKPLKIITQNFNG